ncbi:tumor necrosis factor receptor superfamily member 5 [Sardina pilchardus]|uniref:tumor necrosis factor receptor superfamily member 5 n=1 Tax=Sardina pilchardus TaxID=27697 RepID=UPI002E0D6CE7
MEKYCIVLLIGLHVLQVQCCDRQKQYQNEKGECCNMCGPGTRMPSSSPVNCKEPACVNCKDSEYQGGYTKAVKCSLQPFCDPNLSKESTHPITKVQISPCRCTNGHHCDNQQCATCVPNSHCLPGYKVSENATQETDTKCDECPPGTFLSVSSLESSCQLWTKCTNGKPFQEGTTTTDNICKDGQRVSHIGLAVGAIIFLVVVVAVGVVGYLFAKGKCGGQYTKNCLGTWTWKLEKEKGQEHQFEHQLLNNKDIEAAAVNEQTPRQAEENEVKDEETGPIQEEESSSANHIDTEVRSENGHIIQQEQGKSSILSQTESCPSTASVATECEHC